MNHDLHKTIGEIIIKNNFKNYTIIKDKVCRISPDEEAHNLPLFCSQLKTNATEYCNVDILILKEDKVSVIIEIDESDIKPTQVCGKFLTSALSSFYVYKTKKYKMDDFVLFIQIVDVRKLKEKTSKNTQFNNLEDSIQGLLPLKGCKISKYKLLKIKKNTSIDKDLINYINKHLNS